MKKSVFILAAVLLLSSKVFAMHHWLYCDGKGQCWVVDQIGNSVPCGGCAGFWATQLDRVIPVPHTGNPSAVEAPDAVYALLNGADFSHSGTLDADDMAEYNAALDANDVTDMWINPLRLNSAAYDLIYGGSTYLPMFNINTALNVDTHENELTLYSDHDRTIVVTYKTLDMVAITSEEIAISYGYDSRILNTASLSNGSYIMTISTAAGDDEVNLNLVVNH